VTAAAGQRAVIYVRISLDKTGEALGVARQQEACEQLAAARGWTVIQVYVENDTSASAKRPQYAAMLAAAAAGDFDVIIAWAVDRLTRSPREVEDLIDLAEDHGVMVATVAGDLDLTTDQGRLVGRILGSVARGEVERKGARQKAANLQRAEAGQASTGGIRTLGFEPGMGDVIPVEAAHIREGFARFLGGSSLRSIAAEWNTATPPFVTAHGGKWTAFGVRKVLRNPRYAGRSIHQGVVVGTGKWAALVTADDFDLVQAILDDPARKTTPDTARRYLLPGLARCGVDGGDLQTGRTSTGSRTYYCANAKHLCRAAEPIDALIEGLVIARLAMPDAPELVVDPSRPGVADLHAEGAQLDAKLAQLADMLADDLMTKDQFTRATLKARARLSAVTAAMADAARTSALGPFLAAAAGPDEGRADRVRGRWDAVDIDVRRAVVRILFASIIVHGPGRGARVFNPETVTVEWARQ
jgi:site-specific DNA recombinase